MDPLIAKLKGTDGGRILDVATSHGDFLRLLVDSFQRHTGAIGVDMAPDRIEAARERSDGGLCFEVMNAEQLEFEDESFDTVAMRHSLHHLENVPAVLGEMKRVLRPGGLLIVCEVFQSPETLQDNSQRHMHHWWAEVDRVCGVPHFETYTRQEILDIAEGLKLTDTDVFEHLEDYDDSAGHEIVKQMISISNDCIEKLKKRGGPQELIDKGGQLIERFARLGFSDDPVVYVLGRK
ncbi:MAG: methyltransferase domain-containing protein [Candidatus Zixiibacteriota bacterium]|nr:MAG: methyltransferase domain-containing protein [candidate division Zixibacteria bacterium]